MLHLSANSRSFVGVPLCPSESLRLRKAYETDMTDTPVILFRFRTTDRLLEQVPDAEATQLEQLPPPRPPQSPVYDDLDMRLQRTFARYDTQNIGVLYRAQLLELVIAELGEWETPIKLSTGSSDKTIN